MNGAPAFEAISRKVRSGEPLGRADGVYLYTEAPFHALGKLAHQVRTEKNGNRAYYVFKRYLNTTNICYAGCKFCSFAAHEKEARSYRMTAGDIVARACAEPADYDELHIVGGHDPKQTSLEYWIPVIEELHRRVPHVQLALFTAAEIDYMCKRARCTYEEGLRLLRDAGLTSLNGGGAEILVARVRKLVCPRKASAEEWLEVHRVAHRLGIKTNCTMLYGHVETIEERVEHLALLRELQAETGGFKCFVPLAFHPEGNDLEEYGWTGGIDDLRTIAVSRLMLDNIDHIKAYWISYGIKLAQLGLHFGADDIDGTVDNEQRIYREAGSTTDQSTPAQELKRAIKEAGFEPTRRNLLYAVMEPA
ncbi:MAG: CofH family radical SAM protein [Candidatus Eremiobacteraeota bacterium]|nr:CofH family radical SAM protein [Candidatus Eremiobacteraeota bacterium]MBC5827781.1 CofH family radical SAM protein [Candidatus Eremiobacteraeota bacterium]